MANFWYDAGQKAIDDGSVDFLADTIKYALLTSSYTPDRTHANFSDLTNEVTGTGYTAGGVTLTSKTLTKDTTNHRSVFGADDPQWASSTITARYGVAYKSTGTAGTSTLLLLVDFGSNQSSSSSTFRVQQNANGLAYHQN